MFTYPAKEHDGLSLLNDGELSPDEAQRVRSRLAENPEQESLFRQIQQTSAILSESPDEELVEESRRRVGERLHSAGFASPTRDSNAVAEWWHRSISIPTPVVAAASILFLVMSVGLILNSRPFAGQRYTAGEIASDRPVNVQVQMNGDQSDLLLRWLEQQNQVGSVTIELPEHAEFQLRGEPVLMRPMDAGPRTNGSDQLEIIPLEATDE